MGMFIFGIIWTLYSIHVGYLFGYNDAFDGFPIFWRAIFCLIMSPAFIFICIIFGFLALFSNGAKELFWDMLGEVFPI